MTQVLETPAVRASQTPSQRMRLSMAAARLSFTWFGVRKSLTSEQKAVAAESFGAEGEFLSAGKKLLDTKHPAFRAVTAVRGRVQAIWKGMSLPYPEPGLRLIRRDQIEDFNRLMHDLKEELADAVAELDIRFADLRTAAGQRLGRLFNANDYPETLVGLFGMEWEFPAIEPPSYLQQLSPVLFEQERQRMAARFDEAVRLAEQAFADELARLVTHLNERLSGSEDGKPKVFRDSAVTNLAEFFERFRSLNVRSNDELDALVSRCQDVVRGVDAQTLRTNLPLREQVVEHLAHVQTSLDGMMVDRPRRRIIRSTVPQEAT